MAAKKKMGFEESMTRLEEIVEELEAGEFSLEESIKKFEEGLELGKKCRSMLDEADEKIKILVEDEDGELEEKDAPDDLQG
jgi:exodeoxyribonuclease VII small subunit